MAKTNRIGERSKSNNGQWMEITEYFNYKNITVRFEDGTIVKNRRYDHFKTGTIKNPNYNSYDKTNETIRANNGQIMQIIKHNGCSDLTIRFEDGTIVYNQKYGSFKRGKISNPNYNPYSRIGETNKANNGQTMKIIEWFRYDNITVCFEDETIVYNKKYGAFKKGEIKNPNYKNIKKAHNFINRISETNIATNGQRMTIIAYRNCKDIDIQFEDGTIVYNKCYREFKKGNIGNPNYKIAVGISCNEFAIYYYLKKYGFIKKEQGSLKDLGFGRMELDCYHPDYKIAIEYDGMIHATRQSDDKRKNKECKQNGITIIRIREPKCPILNDNSMEYRIDSNERFSTSFESALKKVFKYINSITNLNVDENISFKRDKKLILEEFNKIYVNKDNNSRLGETAIASNGKKMTIIAYRGSMDIDIQFEDGTIVYNKRYGDFKRGQISNPNYNPHDKTGKITRANNGQIMMIVVYRKWTDIDVQFEDGTIVTNKDYKSFKKGQIANPNYRVNEKRKANNGQWMEIIEYFNYKNITVQFEDGTIVTNKDYQSFKTGKIANPNYNPYNRVGEETIASNGQKMTIIAYRSAIDIDIQFEDRTIVKNKNYGNFKKGNITNPNFKKVA